ncbi:MAG: amino acid ABC transporter permease [Ilumatobacter sp.]|jgi:general L-amino acid transport system permease protein|uniref:amino acid ABC transporter permease n=1 Tax=Ilumatobacter sp. TaxID=1967498 RepID=UPI00391DEF97
MTNEVGYTVSAADGGGSIMHGLAESNAPRHSDQTPQEWVRSNLFNTWYNSIITVVFGALALVLGFLFLRFVFVNARWEPVSDNLELFMVGRFPREDRTRMIVQLLMLSGTIGLFVGWLRQRAQAEAELSGTDLQLAGGRDLIGSYWAFVVFIVVALGIGAGFGSWRPWLLLAGCLFTAGASFAVTLRPRRGGTGIALALTPLTPLLVAAGVLSTISDLDNASAYLIAGGAVALLAAVQYLHRASFTLSAAALAGVLSFQVLSGTEQLAWVFVTVALLPAAFDLVGRRDDGDASATSGVIGAVMFGAGVVLYVALAGLTSIRAGVLAAGLVVAVFALVAALSGRPGNGRRLGTVAGLGLVTWQLGRWVDLDGIDWKDWGGLHLNLVVAAASISLAFPIGLLLALGRRSSLPVMRWLCTAYIELIRGVPLISLLLMAQLFVGFFLSSGSNNLTLTTKSLFVITMFSSAYIAEIVRGGLQAVPRGQVEAGQAMGLSPSKITRLIVLPQALRAVIPSMVGQFISLFKDTSLLTIIGVLEFLGVREIVHSQPDFRGFGLVETLVFVAFGFWAISFTMSRESQRLERRLDVSN